MILVSGTKDMCDTFLPGKDPAHAYHNPYLKTSEGSNAKTNVKKQEENQEIFFSL